MRQSPDKMYEFLEELQSFSDDDLLEALPFGAPAPMIRAGLAAAARSVPDDAAELDDMLSKIEQLCRNLQSDREPDAAPAEA